MRLPAGVGLRHGGAADAPLVVDLLDEAVRWMVARGQTGQWGTEPWSARPAAVERIQAMAGSGGLWLLEDTGRAAGALVVGEHPEHVAPVDEPELYVELLVTSRAQAGRSFGSVLVEQAIALARERGVALLRVDCWAGAPPLVAWYERQGFVRSDTFTVRGDWHGQVFAMRLDAAG